MTGPHEGGLTALIADGARTRPPEPAASAAKTIAWALRDLHPGTLAVLMYGSSLRDGAVEGRVLDFYVLVERTGPAYRSALPRLLARIDQPNVHYLPAGDGRPAPSKYALMTLSEFARRAGPAGRASYIWGRFAQPSWLVWTRDEAAGRAVTDALTSAARTMYGSAAPLEPEHANAEAVWTRAFSESYRSEPRAEPAGKAAELYRANAARYDAIAAAIRAEGGAQGSAGEAEAAWAWRRRWGKAAAVGRIVKSALTFQGGVDYAIWKIQRHSTVEIAEPQWAPRHPRTARWLTLWRLVTRRAIR